MKHRLVNPLNWNDEKSQNMSASMGCMACSNELDGAEGGVTRNAFTTPNEAEERLLVVIDDRQSRGLVCRDWTCQ